MLYYITAAAHERHLKGVALDTGLGNEVAV